MASIYDIVQSIQNVDKSEEDLYREVKKAEEGTKDYKGKLRSRYIKKAKKIQEDALEKAKERKKKFGGLGKVWDVASFFIPGGWALKGLLGGVIKGAETYDYVKNLKNDLKGVGGMGSEFKGTFLEDAAAGFASAQKEQLSSLDPSKAGLTSLSSSLISSGLGQGITKGIGGKLKDVVKGQKIAKTEKLLEGDTALAEKFSQAEEAFKNFSTEDLKAITVKEGQLSGIENTSMYKQYEEKMKQGVEGDYDISLKGGDTGAFGLKGDELRTFLEYQEAKGVNVPSWSGTGKNLIDKRDIELPDNWKESMQDRTFFDKNAWLGADYVKGETFADSMKARGGGAKGVIGTLGAKLGQGLAAPFKKDTLKQIADTGIEGADLGLWTPLWQQKQGTHWTDLAAPEPHEWFKNLTGFESRVPNQ